MMLTSFIQNRGSIVESKKRGREEFEDVSDSSAEDKEERSHVQEQARRILPIKQEGAKRRKLDPVPQVIKAGGSVPPQS